MRVLCVYEELEQCSWWCRLWCRRENDVFLKNFSYFCFILFCLQLAINCIKKNNDKKKKFVSFFILFLLFIKKRKINVKHLFIRFKLIFLFSGFLFFCFYLRVDFSMSFPAELVCLSFALISLSFGWKMIKYKFSVKFVVLLQRVFFRFKLRFFMENVFSNPLEYKCFFIFFGNLRRKQVL